MPIGLHKSSIVAAVVGLGVFVTRLPFLNAGYGRDPDVWRLANAAFSIAETGQYTVSRKPGYPVPEFSYAALSGVHQLWLPLVALLGGVAGALFALILRRLGSKDYILGGFALGFTPTIFINSTTLMDYTWALAAVLAALYALMCQRFVLAGVLTGIAIGSRITSGVMALPFVLLILFPNGGFDRGRINSAVMYAVSAMVVSALLYLPGVREYGFGLFTYIDDSPRLDIIVKGATTRIWGKLGSAAIAVALVGGVVNRLLGSRLNTTSTERPTTGFIAACLVAVGAFALAYLQLPGVAGYLITAIPFVLLCLAMFVPRLFFWVVCGALIVSPFVDFDRSGIREGLLLRDRKLRMISTRKADNIVNSVDRISSDKVLLIAGRLTPQLQALSWREKLYERHSKLTIIYTVDSSQLATYVSGGFDAYFVPDYDIYPDIAAIPDWIRGGAKPLTY